MQCTCRRDTPTHEPACFVFGLAYLVCSTADSLCVQAIRSLCAAASHYWYAVPRRCIPLYCAVAARNTHTTYITAGGSVFQHHRSAARVHTHQQMTSLQSFGDFDTPLAVLPTHSFELVYSKGRMCAAASHHACTTAGAYYSPLWWLLMDCLLQQQVRARAGAMAACDAHTCLLQTVGCT